MFGYVRIHAPELRVREYECYRAAYCGLCREMGRCTGCASRLTLSYDFAFLCLLRLCVSGERPRFARRRCAMHPLKKRAMMEKNAALSHCARCAAILTYHKVKDDLADERGVRRLRAALARPAASRWRRRARREYEALDGSVAEKLKALSALEREESPSADLPASLFGEILRDICAFGLDGSQKAIAGNLGYHTGRWIYLVDALDDRKQDAADGAYNPFVLLYGGGELSEERQATLKAHLTEELMGIERALDLIDTDPAFPEGPAILRNILYLGMPRVVRDILEKQETNDE